MAKIIKIDNTQVLVGMDDGSVIEVSSTEFNFDLHVGLVVDVHTHDDKYIFSRNLQAFEDSEPEIQGQVYVNKTTYGLLYFFTGPIGVHEFYAGNPKKGLLWILSLIVLIIVLITVVYQMIIAGDYNERETGVAINIILYSYIIITKIPAIITLCKTPNKNGNILVSKW